MRIASQILIGLIAALHIWFLVLEMFLFTTPTGRETFGITAEQAETMSTLAKNQGLYNGFLAAGLIWGLLAADPFARHVKTFFLVCVTLAGIYGGITLSPATFLVQGLPAILALALTWWAR